MTDVDPLYARSALVERTAQPAAESEDVSDESGDQSIDHESDTDNEEQEATEEKSEDGQDSESDKEGEDESTETHASNAEVTEAKRIVRLVKEDPEAFAKEFGVDTFGPRFAALAKQSSGLRQREQELKAYEQRIKEADAILSAIQKDPVAFAEEHLGQDGYERWTEAILGKDKPESAIVDKLMKRIDDLEQKLAKGVDGGQTDPNQAVYDNNAVRFWAAYKGEVDKPEYGKLRRFVGDESLQKDVLEVQSAALEAGKWLTPTEILSILQDELESRLKALDETSTDPTVEGSKKQVPAPEASQGPATVTSDMRSTVGRLSEDPEWDSLSEREQMRRIAARYKE